MHLQFFYHFLHHLFKAWFILKFGTIIIQLPTILFRKRFPLHPISVDCINMNRNQQNILQFTSSQEGANSLKFKRNWNSVNWLSKIIVGNQDQISGLVERCPSHIGSFVAKMTENSKGSNQQWVSFLYRFQQVCSSWLC